MEQCVRACVCKDLTIMIHMSVGDLGIYQEPDIDEKLDCHTVRY